MKRAVFLDRDGTLVEDPGYLHDPENVVWKEGVLDGLRTLKEAGHLLIVVTNQSGIGRGLFTIGDTNAVHARMQEEAARAGCALDAYYNCPHVPEDVCACRKPNAGMLMQAAREHDIDLASSWFIGDRCTDILSGQRAGVRTILIGTGRCLPEPDYVCDGFAAAAQTALER